MVLFFADGPFYVLLRMQIITDFWSIEIVHKRKEVNLLSFVSSVLYRQYKGLLNNANAGWWNTLHAINYYLNTSIYNMHLVTKAHLALRAISGSSRYKLYNK
jgi:hypothetical protein